MDGDLHDDTFGFAVGRSEFFDLDKMPENELFASALGEGLDETLDEDEDFSELPLGDDTLYDSLGESDEDEFGEHIMIHKKPVAPVPQSPQRVAMPSSGTNFEPKDLWKLKPPMGDSSIWSPEMDDTPPSRFPGPAMGLTDRPPPGITPPQARYSSSPSKVHQPLAHLQYPPGYEPKPAGPSLGPPVSAYRQPGGTDVNPNLRKLFSEASPAQTSFQGIPGAKAISVSDIESSMAAVKTSKLPSPSPKKPLPANTLSVEEIESKFKSVDVSGDKTGGAPQPQQPQQPQTPPLSLLLSPPQIAELQKLPQQQQTVIIQHLQKTYLAQHGPSQQTRQFPPSTQQSPQPQQPHTQPLPQSPPQQPQQPEPESEEATTSERSMPRRQRWKKHKEFMLADEIDSVIKNQEYHLMRENLFLEDYYYQNWMRKSNPDLISEETIYRHKPICDSYVATPQKKRPPMKTDSEKKTSATTTTTAADAKATEPPKDPLEGVLGRIPASLAKGPRPILDLKEFAEGVDGSITSTGRSFVVHTPGITSLHRRLLLSIEEGYISLLEVEDLDLILSGLKTQTDSNFNKKTLLEKRVEHTNRLYNIFRVSPVSNIDSSPNDEFFLGIIASPKGQKLMTRALPLFFSPQVVASLSAVMRNLNTIASQSTNEEEEQRLKDVFQVVLAALNSLSLSQFFLVFRTLLASQSGTPHLNRKLIKTIKSKVGIIVFLTFLKRGHDAKNILSNNQYVGGPGQPTLAEANDLMYQWQQLYTTLYTNLLSSKLSSLFTSGLTVGYSSQADIDHVWEFLVLFSAGANVIQKQEILQELRSIIYTAMQPTSPTGTGTVTPPSPPQSLLVLLKVLGVQM